MKNKIALALDVPNLESAKVLLNQVEPYIGAVKIGLELFVSVGPDILKITNLPVILDLKLHDIPETVARTIKVIGNLGVKFTTLHIQQRQTMEMAAKAAEEFDMKLLGVAILTSMNEKDVADIFGTRPLLSTDLKRHMNRLVNFARESGIKGAVCSPHEIKDLRQQFADNFFLVPGIRPVNADMADQKRIGTPQQAIQDGANLIVIGRPIRDAVSPAKAASNILEDIFKN